MATPPLRYSAFTYQGRGGNPAGVVLDARGLHEAQMLAIASELGYSETAFLFPDDSIASASIDTSDGSFVADIRYFSPLAEVAFCGHATLASAAALAHRRGPGEVLLHTQAGPIRVETWTVNGAAGATLTSPPASSRPAQANEVDATLAALGWCAQDLDTRFEPHVAFAGNHHLILAVRSRETLAGMTYDFAALQALMAQSSWTTVHVFWAESGTVFHARNPFPPGGIVEDPATGAAAAAFGGYLRQIGHLRTGKATILQGHDMGSPSELTIELIAGRPEVQVSGLATPLPDPPFS